MSCRTRILDSLIGNDLNFKKCFRVCETEAENYVNVIFIFVHLLISLCYKERAMACLEAVCGPFLHAYLVVSIMCHCIIKL